MSSSPSDQMLAFLSQSLPLVERGKDVLIDRMSSYFDAADSDPADNSEMIAMMLVELMLNQAIHLVRSAGVPDPDEIRREHQALDIHGRHYSQFGDALVPILTDLLGPGAPRAVAGAWCDAFWATIREVQASGPSTVDA